MNNLKNTALKPIIYTLILLGICACTDKTGNSDKSELADTIQSPPPIIELIDTLPIIPEGIVQKEFMKSLAAHSYHSLLKKEFPFNDWLTAINDKDSILKVNLEIDSLIFNFSKKGNNTLNLADEWQLKYFLNKGWYQLGLDKTTINAN